MRKILITGIQGAGKTTVSVELAKKGCPNLDSDDISRWVDANGILLTSKRPDNPSAAWLRSHAWIMDRAKLDVFFDQTIGYSAVLCGLSWDQKEYYSIFDTIILLSADEPTIRRRLARRDSTNEFGKQPDELQFILKRCSLFQANAITAGAVEVDAQQPLETVIRQIIQVIT